MLTIKNGVRWFGAACVGALLLTGCAPPGPRALLKGRNHLEKGDYAEAVKSLQLATELMKTNARAFNYLGLAYHHAGQQAEAEIAYQRAFTLNHDLSEAHYNLGCLFLEQNKLDRAKSEFTAFTLRRANAAEGFVKLGTVQLRLRETLNAERSFQDALRFQADNPEALTGLGLTRMQRGKAMEAAQFFQTALTHQSNYGPALLNLAAVEQKSLGNPAAALIHYKQYLATKPPLVEAAAMQGLVQQLERQTGATQQPALARNAPAPRSSPAEFRTNPAAVSASNPARVPAVGSPDYTRPEPARTNPLARPDSRVEPSRPAVVRAAPVASNAPPVGQPPGIPPAEVVHLTAEPVFQAAVDAPRHPVPPAASSATNSARVSKAPAPEKKSFLQKLNPLNLFGGSPKVEPAPVSPATNTTSAGPTWRRYAYLNPARPKPGNAAQADLAFSQGWQAHQAQKLPQAMQSYRKAVQLDPACYKAYYNLGVAAADSGNLPAGLTAYEAALAIKPESIDARFNLALLLKQGAYLPDAANELQKVLTLNPSESRAHLVLGNLYAGQLANPANARFHYMRVLETDPRNPQASTIRYWLADHPQ